MSEKPLNATGWSQRRAKIQDAARLAPVSLSTVSGVLNEKSNVRPETRRRVLDAIEGVGYRPNVFASNLARRRAKIIDIVVSGLLNPFFEERAKSLDKEAKRLGYETFLIATNFSYESQRSGVQQMLAMRVAGVAMMTSENDSEAFDLLKNSGTPSVDLDNNRVSPKIGTVRVDKRHGMFVAVNYLLQLGHRGILLVKYSQQAVSDPPLFSHLERQLGFEDAIYRYDSQEINVYVVDEPGPSATAGLRAIEHALLSYVFTAVVANSDLVALGVFHGLQEARGVSPKT